MRLEKGSNENRCVRAADPGAAPWHRNRNADQPAALPDWHLQQLHCVHVQLAHLQQAQGFSLQMELFI